MISIRALSFATCLLLACEKPRETRTAEHHEALADASPPTSDAGAGADASAPLPDAGFVAPNDTHEPAKKPAWATGSTKERLRALAVTDESWARRDLVTWTTPTQIEALRQSRVLLVATATTNGPPSPFVFLVGTLARKKNSVGAIAALLADDPRFAKRRYAWTSGFPTALGLSGKRYGNELVAVRLREDALVVALRPEEKPPIVVRDLAQKEIPLEEALKQASRIGAVYHVRTGTDVPTRFREYVIVNEAAVERWAFGTPDVHAEIDAETELLRDLDAELAAAPPGGKTRHDLTAFKHIDASSPLGALWTSALAFPTPRYALEPEHVRAALEALGEYDRKTPVLEVRP